MESDETRGEMKDILGDLFQGAITYGEAGQFFTPAPVARMMAQMTVGDVPEEEKHKVKSICDPACGSGRMLLAVAEEHPHWLFVGRDIDIRCVRMCVLNLAFRNLYGYVIHGNSLADEQRLVYRTGFDLKGFISEVPIEDCPEPVQQVVVQLPSPPAGHLPQSSDGHESSPDKPDDEPPAPGRQLMMF